jgi:RNA recognition motif-containing protein
MDGHYIDGYALEVSYKPAIPIPRHQLIPTPAESLDPTRGSLSPQALWTGAPSIPNPYAASSVPPISAPESQSFAVWPGYTSAVRDVVPTLQSTPTVIQPPVPTVAPEPSPPPPYSALPPIPEALPESSTRTVSPARDTAAEIDPLPPKTPYDPCNLFIKNLDDEVFSTERDLETFFSFYGTITSAFLATYAPSDESTPPVSKGFGFVAFSRPQEAESAKDKLHGMLIGRKRIFVSFAEKKEVRQARLKILFAKVEKLVKDGEQKGHLDIETLDAMRDEGISARGLSRPGMIEGNPDNLCVSPSKLPRPNKRAPQHRRRKNYESHDREFFSLLSASGNLGNQETLPDIDFHDDFPPLPSSVQPEPSPALQKMSTRIPIQTQSSQDSESIGLFSSTLDVPGQPSTPIVSRAQIMESENDFQSLDSSVQATPAIPIAPPPSSAELSRANTADSTPTAVYIRPRITLQSLHDRLVHANASLSTLQEVRPLPMPNPPPIGPLLGPTIAFDTAAEMVQPVLGNSSDTISIASPRKTTVTVDAVALTA